jgi:phosphoribosylformylglycinamidine synthase subunit PurQ / glutaminase
LSVANCFVRRISDLLLPWCFGFRITCFLNASLVLRISDLVLPSCFGFGSSDFEKMRPSAIVLRAPGTNCDEETAEAWRQAGAEVETWHINQLFDARAKLRGFQILTIPGGFSYGDDLGAGRIMATRLEIALGEELRRFRDSGGLILGICNGFQALVRGGFLPGAAAYGAATLAHNDSGRFEDRWVRLVPRSGHSPFVIFDEPIELPVAHGEGKWVMADTDALDRLEHSGQIVLQYADDSGKPTLKYPANPNGSTAAVAGLCDPTGRIFGLMPHPERHIDPLQHPRWTRRRDDLPANGDGLRIFQSAVAACR